MGYIEIACLKKNAWWVSKRIFPRVLHFRESSPDARMHLYKLLNNYNIESGSNLVVQYPSFETTDPTGPAFLYGGILEDMKVFLPEVKVEPLVVRDGKMMNLKPTAVVIASDLLSFYKNCPRNQVLRSIFKEAGDTLAVIPYSENREDVYEQINNALARVAKTGELESFITFTKTALVSYATATRIMKCINPNNRTEYPISAPMIRMLVDYWGTYLGKLHYVDASDESGMDDNLEAYTTAFAYELAFKFMMTGSLNLNDGYSLSYRYYMGVAKHVYPHNDLEAINAKAVSLANDVLKGKLEGTGLNSMMYETTKVQRIKDSATMVKMDAIIRTLSANLELKLLPNDASYELTESQISMIVYEFGRDSLRIQPGDTKTGFYHEFVDNGKRYTLFRFKQNDQIVFGITHLPNGMVELIELTGSKAFKYVYSY